MRHVAVLGVVAVLVVGSQFTHASGTSEPLWAYGFLTPPGPGDLAGRQNPPAGRVIRPNEDVREQTRPRRVDGSAQAYSLVDIRDGQNVIDWFPGDHPPMPDIIRRGPASLGKATRGCGSCHLANGKGRPENAQPGGLPAAYIIRQLEDFRLGFRRSADWRKPNTNTMVNLAMAMSDDEVRQAAEYFAAIPWTTPWVRVIETDRVPKTRIQGNLFIAISEQRTEPIAGRIIEVPQDEEQAELNRNSHSGFLAYAPLGSIRRGEDLVTTGGAIYAGGQVVSRRTLACTSCHGRDLMGIDDVPPIAGRSPSYMARQLYDFQQGTRSGSAGQLMKPVVAALTEEDIVAITAYVASRPPVRSFVPTPGSHQPAVIDTSALRRPDPGSRIPDRGSPALASR